MSVTVVESESPSLEVTPTEAPTNENDVAIAAIEAEAAVIINAQNNEAQTEATEALAEVETARLESDEKWASLIAENQRLQTELATLQASLLPVSLEEAPEVVETIAEEIAEEIAEDLTPQSTSEETSLTPTEAIEKSEDEKPVVPPVLAIGRKPIIQLV